MARVAARHERDAESAVAEALTQQLRDAIASQPRYVSALAVIRDPDERRMAIEDTVGRMLAAVPTENRHNELIGPFYDTAGLERWTGKSRQAIEKWRKANKVLAVATDAHRMLYPSFQFGPHGELLPGLPEVTNALVPQVPNPLTQARWLRAASDRFDGRSAADMLRAGMTAAVVAAAHDDVSRLAA